MSSCDEATTTPTTPVDSTLTTKTISVTPDSANDYLYSLDANAAIGITDLPKSTWDMRVNHVFGGGRTTQIDVLFNSGSVNSTGLTKAYVVDTTFDNVTVVDPTKFRVDSSSTSGRIVSTKLDGSGLFVYNPATHMISTNAMKTLIVQSASGAYYKVQFISISTPASTTALSTFVIRYLKAFGTKLK